MSTSTLGGYVSTISNQQAGGRRRRRLHSDEFKAGAVASCMQPGVSMASVAMSHGINANLLRRWVKAAEMPAEAASSCAPRLAAPKESTATPFVPLALPAAKPPSEIRIELRRGATTVSVTWPAEAGAECAAWMRELLR